MALIKPLVFIDSFDPDKIRQLLAGEVGGVVLREHPRRPLTHLFSRATARRRDELSRVCYVEELDGTRRLQPHSGAQTKSGWGNLPECLQNSLARDMNRLGWVQGGHGHLAMIFKQTKDLRWHIDGMDREVPDAIYLHHHMSGAGLRLLDPKGALEIREDLRDDEAVNLDSGQIKALFKSGQAKEFQLSPGDSVFFGRHMAHASGLGWPRDRYLILPLKNPQAAL